ncbi:CHAD domain-containing protein [Actinocatenispora rupis]|uniref:CHAD domain-containing protein n=1 Tax=Actinocatenispora rupis TaxID=519421 RepID=A0A8J3J3K3_9ACTN|nr:CHAD domain-containing protein [Actinocatenispora rupis]GID11312.1 hypothetical protein Aru02nite_22010 [Actinocatenispora rupis]
MGTAADRVTRYLCTQRDAVRAAAPLVPEGAPDSVHRLRVAVRRLRATLRTFRPLLAAPAGLADELRAFAGELADLRDHEVLADVLAAALAAEPADLLPPDVRTRIDTTLARGTAEGRGRAVAALTDPAYARLVDRLDTFVADPWSGTPHDDAVAHRVDRAIAALDRRLRRGTDDEALHRARKGTKRARYAVEATAGDPALLRRLAAIQDVLGDQHDTVVARELLRRLAADADAAGESSFGYGVLYAAQRSRSAALVGRLAELTRAVRAAAR